MQALTISSSWRTRSSRVARRSPDPELRRPGDVRVRVTRRGAQPSRSVHASRDCRALRITASLDNRRRRQRRRSTRSGTDVTASLSATTSSSTAASATALRVLPRRRAIRSACASEFSANIFRGLSPSIIVVPAANVRAIPTTFRSRRRPRSRWRRSPRGEWSCRARRSGRRRRSRSGALAAASHSPRCRSASRSAHRRGSFPAATKSCAEPRDLGADVTLNRTHCRRRADDSRTHGQAWRRRGPRQRRQGDVGTVAARTRPTRPPCELRGDVGSDRRDRSSPPVLEPMVDHRLDDGQRRGVRRDRRRATALDVSCRSSIAFTSSRTDGRRSSDWRAGSNSARSSCASRERRDGAIRAR